MMAKHEIVLHILCYVCKISESMFKPPSAKQFWLCVIRCVAHMITNMLSWRNVCCVCEKDHCLLCKFRHVKILIFFLLKI